MKLRKNGLCLPSQAGLFWGLGLAAGLLTWWLVKRLSEA